MNEYIPSSDCNVFLNPKLPRHERKFYTKELLKYPGLQGHLWFATSGTEGRFKFVALSHVALQTSAQAVNTHLEVNCKDVWIKTLPTFHVGGMGILVRAYVSGSKVVELKCWDPNFFYQTAKAASATLTSMVPTQIYDLVKANINAPNSLRAVVVGGGVLEKSLYDRALLLGWNLLPSYGLTECASQVATAETGCYSSYKTLSHVEATLNDKGFIILKSASLLSLYAVFEDGNFRFWDPKIGGTFQTEDKGVIENRSLKVLGRRSHFLKILGESVNLQALQAKLDSLKDEVGVEQACVLFPKKDERKGDEVHLVVEGPICPKIEELVRMYHAHCLPYEKISHIIYTDNIPRNALGKVLIR